MKKNKGFTLIELLVVIAIIGILASVVLASLSSARTKGKDAAVSSEISNMRAQAELYYSTTGSNSYGAQTSLCTAGMYATGVVNGLNTLITGVSTQGVTPVCNSAGGTAAASASWAVSAPLPSGGNFCADSTGFSDKGKTSQATGICG